MNNEGRIEDQEMRWVVLVLKHAGLHLAFIDDKQEEFVRSITARYRKYGDAMRMSSKQMDFLVEIAKKLYYFPKI